MGVVVALLMVPLIGFVGISVDVSALWNQKLQLQSGADAGALAIAHDCARRACGTPLQTAQDLASSNMNYDAATASLTDLTTSRVTVKNSGVREYWFAPVFGVNQSTVNTQASAGWGPPSGGTAVLPLAFSYCEFIAQVGGLTSLTEKTISFTKSSGVVGCTGPSSNAVPGGFGWLNTNSGTCNTTSVIAEVVFSSTGNAVPSGCSVADFQALQGKAVLLPIFDQVTDSGSNAYYRVHGYASFKITAYHFGGQYSWNSPCNGNDRCVRGYFTQFVGVTEAFEYNDTAPQLGTTIISLIP